MGLKINNEMVRVFLNRDSICAADDTMDHREVVFVPSDITIKDFIWMVCLDYLQRGSVWRGEWLVYSGDRDTDGLGELFFTINTAHPCTIKLYSDWAEGKGIPEKIYFRNLSEPWLDKSTIGESKESFTLYKEGWLAKLFKIRNK